MTSGVSCNGLPFSKHFKSSFVNHCILDIVINFVSSVQSAPLHWATQEGHSDIVRCLVEEGADINMKGWNGVSD